MNYIRKYEQWVKENSASVSKLEMTARALLQVLPGRFADSELGVEASNTEHLRCISDVNSLLWPEPGFIL